MANKTGVSKERYAKLTEERLSGKLSEEEFKGWKPQCLTYEEAANFPIGVYVFCEKGNGEKFEGVVQFVWISLDEPAISVRTPSGKIMNCLPGMDDEIRIRKETEQ